jgi:RNA polymerase sigma-70 factor, ECF subfamily
LNREVEISELIIRSVKGDNSARLEIYNLYSGAMLSLCHRYARSPDDAKDIYQEGFIKVFENLHMLKNHAALASWMKKIFVNEALKLIKTNTTHMMIDLSDITESYDATSAIIDQMALEEITEIIRKLPDKMRVTFNMYVIEGYSHIEIADALGVSVGTSKSNLHDARLYIQKQMQRMNNPQKLSV